MASRGVLSLLCLVCACVVLSATNAGAAITCNQVISNLAPCANYVANGGVVPGNCCSGIKTLYNTAKTTPDHQAVCNCLKSAAAYAGSGGFNLGLVAGLPGKCGVNLPYKIDPNVDCNKIQ